MANQPAHDSPSRRLAWLAAIVFGLLFGWLLQFGLMRSGRSPLVPSYSLTIALVAIAAVLIVFGLRLKHAIADPKQRVDPFQAVRILVSARAGALVGGLFGGLGAGSALSLLGRSVPAPSGTWMPIVAVCIAGFVLLVCAVIAERWCRVPPGDGEDTAVNDGGEDDGETQVAYRRP